MIDSQNERRAAAPFLWCGFPAPDGAIDAGDRRQVSGVWAFREALLSYPASRRQEVPRESRPDGWELYRTAAGDTLDWVCWAHYGRTRSAVEAVLEANPGLAELGPVLPEGTPLWLPPLPAAPDTPAPRLWSGAAELAGFEAAEASPPEPPALYRTAAGDTLDWLCWRYYGRTAGALAAVLEANPGLAELGLVLPEGTLVALPALSAAAEASLVLWS